MHTQYQFVVLAYKTLLIIVLRVIYKGDKSINVV